MDLATDPKPHASGTYVRGACMKDKTIYEPRAKTEVERRVGYSLTNQSQQSRFGLG